MKETVADVPTPTKKGITDIGFTVSDFLFLIILQYGVFYGLEALFWKKEEKDFEERGEERRRILFELNKEMFVDEKI